MATTDDVRALLDLPFGTLAVMASGYIGYRIAFTGKDKTHATIDVIFLTMVFAALAKFVSISLGSWVSAGQEGGATEFWGAVAALPSAVLAAAAWRRFGEVHVFHALRKLKISHSDRHRTAWETITQRSGVYPSQLIVKKTDGTLLMSECLADFATAPLGPCLLGQDGSVALYVTDTMPQNGDWEKREPFDSKHADWGYVLTYVPASQVSEIRLRAVS